MEAIRKLRDQVAKQQQAVFKQFSGGIYGGSDNVASDENEFQQHQKLEKLYISTRAAKHYQKEIVRGVEGYIVAGSKHVEIGTKLSEDSRKYGSEKTCTSGNTLARAVLSFGRARAQMERECGVLLKALGTQVAEPLRAMIVGAPLEDARHLAQRYARMRQEAEAQGYRYDVFLSFRGEETRKTFTDHLYTALNNAGFLTFRDDDELERGEDIKPGLRKAIQQSRTSVVVFSKDYASSSWCLDELVLILERKRTTSDHVVLPVFYDVDPSHVRKQTGSVRKAFARSQKNQSPEKVEGWRRALAEIADLAGMVLQNQANGCLVTLDEHGKVKMHDMIRAMGREIVRQESEEPEKRSRLWRHKDSFQVLRKKNGTKKIQGLVLDMRNHPANSPINTNEIVLETNAFARMCNLQLLHLSHVRLDGCYADFPTELRWLCWLEFPLDSIPIDFPLENVIVLEMQYSSLRQVCKGTKFLPSLKILDVSHSHGLSETIDFSLSPNLEELILVDCTSLKNVHESIGNLERLVYLNMKDCKNLKMLPKNMCMLKSLETLILSGCSNLDEFPQFLPSLKILDVSHYHGLSETIDFSLFLNLEELILVDCTSLKNVHESIGNLKRLVYLNMKDCKNLRMLPKNMCMLKSLETLILSGCSNLDEFPVEMMKKMESLKVLETDGIPISELWPERSSAILSSFPCSLVELSLKGCNLSDDVLPMDLSNLFYLRRLHLDKNPICNLPVFIKGLRRIDELTFEGCDRLESLVGLPEVHQWISIAGCISLRKITFHSPEKCCPICVGDNWNLVEWECYYKLEPIDRVEVEMIKLLGLCNFESMPVVRMRNPHTYKDPKEVPVQGLYQRGIFSTFFVGNKVPGQFSYKSTKSSISFIVPLLLASHRIRGLNIFATYAKENSNNYFTMPRIAPIMIKVRNKSKGLKWIYSPVFYGIPGDGEDMIWLSHWKMENKTILQCGDEVVVSVITGPRDLFWVKEFGVELVQEHQEKMSTQHNTKSDPNYPFVIGGDLKTWKCIPGIYYLGTWTREDADDIDILTMDSDEEDTNKEGQKDEPDYTIAKTRAASNNCSLRGWKVRLTAVGFFFALALVGWSSISQKKKRVSDTRPQAHHEFVI
ncbi:disease resistance-like protein DSC1 isoform X2 [Pyrus x bretschneideri]|uniref:disease resistance-like protein DSC1 isoform X2 n=2 Tax=Pyrus x bretschneideri TaxID=225117 RepID=UPI0020308A80|nr:disease resistance-like protein DSC1 isoform X2 [Pyrus x bretschneideri]